MERRHFLKLAFGFAAGAAALAASAQAAPLAPQPLTNGRLPPGGDEPGPAVTTENEVDRLEPQEVRWGRRHWGWRRRHWGWRRRHWGWRRRHWGYRRRWHRRRYLAQALLVSMIDAGFGRAGHSPFRLPATAPQQKAPRERGFAVDR